MTTKAALRLEVPWGSGADICFNAPPVKTYGFLISAKALAAIDEFNFYRPNGVGEG